MSGMTFWDHLDELRTVIIRILSVTVVAAVVAFCLKDELFTIVLAPRSSDFITYRLIGGEPFFLSLMNTGLAEQFMIHLRTAMYNHGKGQRDRAGNGETPCPWAPSRYLYP